MTPERWSRIKELFGAALETPAAERPRFLESACVGDAELRVEVERLLAGNEEPSWPSPAAQLVTATAELAPGDTVGPYRIEARLGEGGMGVVYRASDSRLRRSVALKFVKAQFSTRGQREARAVAALNHPNICTLHDVGPNYLVMELIEGPTLAERMAKGAIPLPEALGIARQIAEALEAAHEKGIVHRDLKPANIKFTADGTVKVLDFGLAKAQEPAAGSVENSPTLTFSASQAGMILGTAGYMSPEQANGMPVDKRADIWSFGVVLWELLTGHRLFAGETVTQTLAEVLRGPIDFDQLPRETPAVIRGLLRRCLVRDAKNRLRDIGEARVAIEAALAGEAPLIDGAPQAGGARRWWLGWSVAAALAVGLATLAFLYFREKPPAPAAPVRFQIPLPEYAGQFITLSPDGRKLAFLAGYRLWVHFLESGESRDLTAVGGIPFWSPDSRFIGYSSDGKLRKIGATGGPPQTVSDLAGTWETGAWNQDEVIVIQARTGLFRVPASGGVPVPITALDPARQEKAHFGPSFLPDGRHFVYTRSSNDASKSAIYLGSVDAKPEQQSSKPLIPSSWQAVYAPSTDPSTGHLLFIRDGALMAQPFDNSRMELKGQAMPVAEQVSFDRTNSWAPFSASAGVLTYQAEGLWRLRWFDRKGGRLGDVGPVGEYWDPALSPDGHAVAVSMRTAAQWDIWVFDLVRGTNSRLTFGGGDHYNPGWSPDGRQIAFRFVGGPRWVVHRVFANGAGKEELAAELDRNAMFAQWTGDGRYLILNARGFGKPEEIWAAPASGGGKPFPIVTGPSSNGAGRVSPDGKWIAYIGDETGRTEVYVQNFPPKGGKWQISTAGGWLPIWRADGRELFYREGSRVMAVDVKTNAGRLEAGIPKLLFDAPRSRHVPVFDVSADGQKFLLVVRNEEADAAQSITAVLNWQAGLKK